MAPERIRRGRERGGALIAGNIEHILDTLRVVPVPAGPLGDPSGTGTGGGGNHPSRRHGLRRKGDSGVAGIGATDGVFGCWNHQGDPGPVGGRRDGHGLEAVPGTESGQEGSAGMERGRACW